LSFGLGLVEAAAIFSSTISLSTVNAVVTRVQAFPELDLIFFLFGLSLFYLQSRYMENTADAGAVRLTGDPEAVITGLLKLGRLNLLPVQWGPVTGSLLTHPSTLKRVQRVARVGQLSPDRLQQILSQHQESQSQPGSRELPQPGDTFTEAQPPANRILTTARSTQSALYKLWLLWFFHFAPPALVAWSVYRFHLRNPWAPYVAGAIASVTLYFLVTRWMGSWGRARTQLAFKSKLAAEGIAAADSNALLVGLSPSAELRFYVSNFNWDTGVLFFARERLCYAGDQLRFALKPEQVRSVRLGPGVPGWTSIPRLYVDWWDETSSTVRTWNMVSTMPCSIWTIGKQSQDLYDVMQQWRTQPANYPEAPLPLKDLSAPTTRAVTSRSLKSVYAFGRHLKSTIWLLVMANALGMVLSIPAMWYVSGVILLLRLYEALPYWFYKVPQHGMQSTPVALANVQ
jgi:hypothetical protein